MPTKKKSCSASSKFAKKNKNAKVSRVHETEEDREARLAKRRQQAAHLRSLETPEQRQKHLEADRERQRKKRERERSGQAISTEERLAKSRARAAYYRAFETPEQRQKRLEADRERKRKLRESQRLAEDNSIEERLAKDRIRAACNRAFETPEQRQRRLAADRERKRKLRESQRLAEDKSIEERLAKDRARAAYNRAVETPEQRQRRLAVDRERKRRLRESQRSGQAESPKSHENDRKKKTALKYAIPPQYRALLCNAQNAELYFNFLGNMESLLYKNTPNLSESTSKIDTMDTEEATTAVTIKNEIDIEEEKLIRVKTEIPEIPVELEAPLLENDINTQSIQHFDNIEITIKEEPNSELKDNNYLVERNDYTEKPTVIRDAASFIKQTNVEVNIKEETDESIVTYDYPSFEDGGSMDSSEAEALGKVETCLQDNDLPVHVKCENGDNSENPQKEDFENTEVKIESETIIGTNSSNQIVPDGPSSVPKYSFIMKIPGDLLMDEIVTSCLKNSSTNHESLNSDYNATNNDDVDMKISNECLNVTPEASSLLEESDKSEMISLNQFQLNSITGNFLSLEQEAYNMLKIFRCPRCTKSYKQKHQLIAHLGVHQTIDNYTNGRIRGRETRRKNAKLLEQINETDSPDSSIKDEKVKMENKDGYRCTCGKTYQRRTRMESCLRTHDHSESEKFYCMTCLKDFKSKNHLALHRKRLHRKKFPCKFCPTDYATRKKLFKHLQIHQKVHETEYKVIEEVVNGKQKLRCFLCSKCCEEISELKIHVMSEHKGPYSCPHCKNTFPKIIDFGNHMKIYHPEVEGQSVVDVLEAFSRLTQEWKCEECEMQFLEADKFALHQVEQHSPESKSEHQYQCPDCRRVFISQKGLTSHRRIHHSVETSEQTKVEVSGIMCLECRKMCKDMSALTSHMRFHSPDRKYPCKFCDFRFATPEKRKTHAEIHTGEMKYVCFICEYQCSSENRLKKHKRSLKHANMREYLLTGKPLIEESTSAGTDNKDSNVKKKKKCKEDSESGSDESNSDSEDVSCEVCGEKFPSESKMLEHKETHPFIEIPNADKPTRIFFK